MSRVSEVFVISEDVAQARARVLRAVGQTKTVWLVMRVGDNDVLLRERRLPILRWRVTARISWEHEPAGTRVEIAGRIFGLGPIQKHYCRGLVGQLRAAIEGG